MKVYCDECREPVERIPSEIGEKENSESSKVEKRYPGNKAWARFLASLTASLIVAGFRIFESYLRFVFAVLEEGPMGLAILVTSHIALITFVLTQLF